jgi:hypothetical protein
MGTLNSKLIEVGQKITKHSLNAVESSKFETFCPFIRFGLIAKDVLPTREIPMYNH